MEELVIEVYLAITLVPLLFILCFLLAKVDAPLWDQSGDDD